MTSASYRGALTNPLEDNEMSVLTADYKQTTLSLEALANTLESLYKHNQSLKTVPLVCQNDVLALESLVPGMISNKMPITSFTIDPTRTNLNITTESIGDQLRSVRDRIVKIFKDLWLKVVTWFNSTFRDSKKQSTQAKKDAKDAQDKTNALEPIEEQVAKAVSESLSEKTGQHISPDEIITTLHEESVKVLEKHTSHNAFVVGRGQGFLSLLKNMEGVGQVIKDLSDKTALLSTAVNRGDNIQTELYNVTLDPLGRLIDPKSKDSGTTVEVLRTLLRAVQNGGKPEFAEGELKDLKDKKVQQFLKSSGDLGNVVDNLQRVIDTESGMSSVTSAIDKLDSSVAKIGSGENAAVVNAVVKEFRNVVSIVGMIYTIVKELHKDLCVTASALNKAANGRYKALFSAINDLADKEDWLKQLATMKRSVGLESVDFEVEDSIFEGQDSELATDSHAVPDGKIDELSQAIDNTHKELDDLTTTQNTLEGMGIESFASTIKDVGKKVIEGIKKLIAKLKEWAKAVWAKITGKNSDVAKHAEEAKKAEKAEEVIEKPAEAFVDIVAKEAAKAEHIPEDKRSDDDKKIIELATKLASPEAREAIFQAKSLKYEGLYDELIKQYHLHAPFWILFGRGKSAVTEELLKTANSLSVNIDKLTDTLDFLNSFSNDDIAVWLDGDLERKYVMLAKKYPYDKLYIHEGARIGLELNFDTAIEHGSVLTNLKNTLDSIKAYYDFSSNDQVSRSSEPVPSLNQLKTGEDSIYGFIEQLKSFNVEALDEVIEGFETGLVSLNKDRKEAFSADKMNFAVFNFAIDKHIDFLKCISSYYTLLSKYAVLCDTYFKKIVQIQQRRIRSLREAATFAGTFDSGLFKDIVKHADVLMDALTDPSVTKITL